jgi:outer membrane protein TolC
VLNAVHQVADTMDAIRLLGQETTQQHQARDSIEAAYELAVNRYRAGLGNYLTVLLAQNGVLTQARLDTDLRIRAYKLDADLANALGGGYAPDTQAQAQTDAKNTTH